MTWADKETGGADRPRNEYPDTMVMPLVQIARCMFHLFDEGRLGVVSHDPHFYNPGYWRARMNELEEALKPFPVDL